MPWGFKALSTISPDALCHLLLLSPAAFSVVCGGQADIRGRARARATQLRVVGLRICGHPEPAHVLLSEPKHTTLADAVKSLKQGVSRRLIGEAEHFWQKRYYDFNIRHEAQFVEKLRDIHGNPVKRGLSERPEDWEWSSFLQWATGSEGHVEIECEWTARRRERAAGRLCAAVELPRSSQHRA
jgi:REP element-mobilizing transposase RayT